MTATSTPTVLSLSCTLFLSYLCFLSLVLVGLTLGSHYTVSPFPPFTVSGASCVLHVPSFVRCNFLVFSVFSIAFFPLFSLLPHCTPITRAGLPITPRLRVKKHEIIKSLQSSKVTHRSAFEKSPPQKKKKSLVSSFTVSTNRFDLCLICYLLSDIQLYSQIIVATLAGTERGFRKGNF